MEDQLSLGHLGSWRSLEKEKQYKSLAKVHCKWAYTGYTDTFIVRFHDFCGLQLHMLRTLDKSAKLQF